MTLIVHTIFGTFGFLVLALGLVRQGKILFPLMIQLAILQIIEYKLFTLADWMVSINAHSPKSRANPNENVKIEILSVNE